MDKNLFLKKYNIELEEFEEAGLTWNEVEAIHEDYSSFKTELEPTANYIVERIRNVETVHSTKMRIKDPDHLIEKIIRKNKSSENKIDINNYKTSITDLIGIRALHLFKEDWKTIHEHIKKTWDLNEKPKANIRDGDDDKLFEEAGCEIVRHPLGYRSVHYLVESKPSKDTIVAEIQVRTIFEEGWSEVDHKIRYPYEIGNTMLEGYLKVFNRLAGNADEMASFIVLLKNEVNNMKQKYEIEIEQNKEIITNLKSEIDKLKIEPEQKDELKQKINTLQTTSNSFKFILDFDKFSRDRLFSSFYKSLETEDSISLPGALESSPRSDTLEDLSIDNIP